MDSAVPMAVLVGILALILVGGFMAVWMRDKSRSNEVSDDSGRFDGDPSHRHQTPGH